MTRKDFNELAAALRRARPDWRPDSSYDKDKAHWARAVSEIATVCARHNPRFDRYRFYDACGLRK